MADPISISAGIGIASSVAGGAVGMMGAKQSADASSASYRYKAQVAMMNKQINEQNARWALDSGGIAATEAGLKSRQDIANTKVVQAASGFDINTGSNEAVRETQAEVAAFDQNVIRWDAAKTSYGYSMKAKANQMEADADTAAASNAEHAGVLGMLSSFISGAGSVASKWSQAKSTGMGTNPYYGPLDAQE